MTTVPELSVVVPVYDEVENVPPLVASVQAALEDWRWELVLVDDGSTDGTGDAAARAAARDARVRVVRLARNYGQTVALQAGFDAARADVVVSMDGDLQNDPRDIPRLVARLREGYDLVAGYRQRRQDALVTRKVPSWLANRIVAWLTGVPIRDNGCSLKAYRRDLLARLNLYGDLHRFLPVLAAGAAGARLTELGVRHHPRRHGRSKYGLARIFKVVGDLLTLVMIRAFRDRPLAMFGTGALLTGALGTLTGFAALWQAAAPGVDGTLILPSASLLCFALAGFLFILGLFGEEVLRMLRSPERDLPPLAREVLPA